MGRKPSRPLEEDSGRIEVAEGLEVATFQNQRSDFSFHVGEALRRAGRHGAVKVCTERVGETVNLEGEEQERSVCALLAKKYRLEHATLASLAGSMMSRPLTREECELIRRVVAGLVKKDVGVGL